MELSSARAELTEKHKKHKPDIVKLCLADVGILNPDDIVGPVWDVLDVILGVGAQVVD